VSNKNRKVTNRLSVSFTTFSFCVISEVYTVFFAKKWVALKRAGCWVAEKKTVIAIDLHYKHEAVSEKISKSYNFG